MHSKRTHSKPPKLSRTLLQRQAILLSFCDPPDVARAHIQSLRHADWTALLPWLDTSGLALYFLDRVQELSCCDRTPSSVLTRLRGNLFDNWERMGDLFADFETILSAFREANVTCATLKGFSLCPHAVPHLQLRSQLDLDFLVTEASASEARRALQELGYRLHAISGRSWEFKSNEGDCPRSLADLYTPVSCRSVELHLEGPCAEDSSLLHRVEHRWVEDVSIPVLPAADLFLGQALHLYKHLCSEFLRTAHVLELRRHVLHRKGDAAFWAEVHQRAASYPDAPFKLSLVIALITHIMGPFAPPELTGWTLPLLTAKVRLWIELYGHRAVLGSFPGNKLYLLLQPELPTGTARVQRSLRQALVPLRLPPRLTLPTPGETPATRLRRYRQQLRFIGVRLRFHLFAGIAVLREHPRWRRHLRELAG